MDLLTCHSKSHGSYSLVVELKRGCMSKYTANLKSRHDLEKKLGRVKSPDMNLASNFKTDKRFCTVVGHAKVLGILAQLLTNSLASRNMGKMKKGGFRGRKGGGTNRSDAGLNLSGSWQQGHSATYNTPSRI